MDKSTREALILQVRCGRLSPEQAEAEAARHGLAPLASFPLSDAFDPMQEIDWSLPMALEWMVWRLPERVREVWDAYRGEVWEWRSEPWQEETGGPERHGYVLKRREPASLNRMLQSGRFDEAIEFLDQALRDGRVRASGVEVANGIHRDIACDEWTAGDRASLTRGAVKAGGAGGPLDILGHDVVKVRREDVMQICPPRASSKREMPAILPPVGPGYMPLVCAAQWIASEGGSVTFDPDDDNDWQPAFDTLLAHISSEAVAVVGVRGSERSRLDGAQFAGCRVSYPSGSIPDSLMFGRELYLMSYLYIDDVHWRGGFDDALMTGVERVWTQLMVSREDVARIWPFDVDVGYRTGAPGRPTSRHLVASELVARSERQELKSTLSDESAELALWLAREHPRAPPMTAKSIRSSIRDVYWKLKRARN